MRQICRTCEHKLDCLKEHSKEDRERQDNCRWDEWTCGHWQEAKHIAITMYDIEDVEE